MNEIPERIARLCGRIMQTAVEVTAAGRHQASAEFRGAGRIVEVAGYRINNGAIDNESRTNLRVQLNNPYAEYLLEQVLNTLEAMR